MTTSPNNESNSERPTSPHLTIYKPQISSTLSIMHRITGIVLFGSFSLLLWLLIIAVFADSPYIIDTLHESWLFKFATFGTMYALFFHFSTGIRHLFWNIGKGYEIKTIHITGWLAVVASIIMLVIFYLYIIS